MSTPRICPTCGKPVPTDAPHDVCPACLLQGGFATGSMDSGVPGSKPRFTAPTLDELTPLFPQLELIEFIGQGGMGAVYKARQRELGRLVALKILPPGIGDDPTFAERFTREARALAQLNHPGIVTLYEFGKVGQASSLSPATPDTPETAPRFLYYFLMEFVDGVNLRQLLRTERVSPREALAIVPQICDALQFAHDQGIVHRDIKPENILLDRRGRVKVADFGLAKLVGNEAHLIPSLSPSDGERVADRPGEEATALTAEGKVMGTPHYMAPEQSARPAEVDHRADIYALGVVFYQMLTGELPDKQLQPPSKKVQIDVRLDEIVLRALERNPDRRYQQVSQVKMGLETISESPRPRGREHESTPSIGAGGQRRLTSTATTPSHARLSLALFLAGTLGTLLLMTVSHHHDMALIFGSVALVLALVFGCLSWRQRMGKSVAIATMLLAAGIGIIALFLVWTPPWTRKAVDRMQALAMWNSHQLARQQSFANYPTNITNIPGTLVRSHPFGIVQLVAVEYDPPTDDTWPAEATNFRRFQGPTSIRWIPAVPKGQNRLVGVVLKLTSTGSFGRPSLPLIRFSSGPTSGMTHKFYKEDGTVVFLASSTTAINTNGITVGVADGPWETVQTVDPSGEGIGKNARLAVNLKHHESNGWEVWETPATTNQEVRIVFTFQGGEVVSNDGATIEQNQASGQIPALLKPGLTRIEIQRRPLQWVTFSDVAVQENDGSAVPIPQPQPDYGLIQYRLVAEADDTNSPIDIVSLSGPSIEPRELRILKEVGMDGRSIAKARLVSWDSSDRQIELTFTPEGKKQFADLTRTNKGRLLATFYRGRLDTVSVISSEIGVGKGSLFLKATESEATDRVWRLNQFHSKSAPATLEGTLLLEANGPNESPVGKAGLLDLDTGEVIRWPAEMGDWNGTKLDRWIVESGADLLTISSQPSSDPANLETKLVSATTLLVQLDEAAWDKTPSRSEILRLIEQGAPSLCLDPKNENAVFPNPLRLVDLSRFLPITAAFRTAEGTVGVIQILGTNKKPRGFNVRHKTLPPIIAEGAP